LSFFSALTSFAVSVFGVGASKTAPALPLFSYNKRVSGIAIANSAQKTKKKKKRCYLV
jgi:hypothetical protein